MLFATSPSLDTGVSTEGLAINSTIKTIIQQTPVVLPKDLIDASLPGDVLLAAAPRYRVEKSRTVQWFIKTLKVVQRSPYNTSKMFGGNHKLVGYGVAEWQVSRGFRSYSAKVLIPRMQQAMLIRHKDISPAQRAAIVEHAMKQIDLPYKNSDLISSAIFHLLRKVGLYKHSSDANVSLAGDDIPEFLEPLVCSSIIGALYQKQGLRVAASFDWRHVWPGDFLLDGFFFPVCRLDR